MDYTLLSGILLSLIFATFFSGVEVAFLSANKIHIELFSKQKKLTGQILMFFVDRPTWFIGTTLVGNVASLIFFGIFSTQALLPLLHQWLPTYVGAVVLPVIVFTFLLTVFILYTVEYLSKSFFVIHGTAVVLGLSIPFVFVFIVLFPFVYLIITLARIISTYVMKLEYSMEKPVFGLSDVTQYLKTIQTEKPAEANIAVDTKIYTNALEFKSVRVRDCMIPRTEIAAVSLESGIKKLHEAFIESGHSKIIIFKDSIDDVIGYCHSSALFKKPNRIEDILTAIITVPETMMAKDLLVLFINERKSLASVIDEFGGTSGIVSMEDVIEEIFGEIEDEHDETDKVEVQLAPDVFLLSARLEVEYLNEKYSWHLPLGDYDTLSGLILSYTAELPKQGDTIKIASYTMIIQSTSQNKINTVRLVDESKTLNT
jgi:putative hemolysin